MDTLRTQLNMFLGSTILSFTIPQAHQLLMSSIFIKITIKIYLYGQRDQFTIPFQQARVRGMLFSLPEGTLTSALLSRINLATE